MNRAVQPFVLVIVFLLVGSCGDDTSSSPRATAEAFVAALRDHDWEAACDVSVHDGRDHCVQLVQRAFADEDQIPSVSKVEKMVEKIDGRYLVHFEVAVIN